MNIHKNARLPPQRREAMALAGLGGGLTMANLPALTGWRQRSFRAAPQSAAAGCKVEKMHPLYYPAQHGAPGRARLDSMAVNPSTWTGDGASVRKQ